VPITPPDGDPSPKWASDLVRAANVRNRARMSPEVYSMTDLVAAWETCGGCCALSGMPFSLEVYGDGQAKRPFAPSLDRIDRHKPYQKNNVRLVAVVANFAMNAWGDEPVFRMASFLHRKIGDRKPSIRPAPSDGDLDYIAALDTEFVETDTGVVAFPPRLDMHRPILTLLRQGSLSSRDLEDALAKRFGITARMRMVKQGNGSSAWRNRVAWVLGDLGTRNRGPGQVERTETKTAPDGGTMGLYRLKGSRPAPR